MVVVIYRYTAILSNNNGPHEIHVEVLAFESIHSFSKRNEPYHTRFKKSGGGTNRRETQLLWQETQSASGRSETAILQILIILS